MDSTTEMIYSLLQEIEMAVSCSRHGLRVLYKILERAWDLYDELNQRVSQVETGSGGDGYQTYTQAIDPPGKCATLSSSQGRFLSYMNKVLLDVIPAIYDDQTHLVAPVSPDDLIESVEKWLVDNRIICECLRRLETEAKLGGLTSSSRDIETEILNSNAQDCYDLFVELMPEVIEKAAQCTQPNIRVLLKHILRSLQRAQDVGAKDPLRAVDEEWCTASVQCAMLTRGMLINLTRAPTSHSLPNDFGWGGIVWKRVLGMVPLINKALSETLPPKPIVGWLPSLQTKTLSETLPSETPALDTAKLRVANQPTYPRKPVG
ncbi:unnamed protein product, partial [Rhizoctonia solani]